MNRPDRAGSWCLPALLLLLLPACAEREPELDVADPGPGGAVAAGTPEATRVGLEVLAQGGNAIDAAVAVSLALGVTEPSQSGLGGRVVMLVRPVGSDPVLVHVPPVDAGAPGSPDALLVLHHAWSRWGSETLDWEALVEPARRLALEGYALGRFRHRTLVQAYDRVLRDSAAAALFLAEDRSIPSEQTVLTNPDLAATLAEVARGGPDALYAGEMGERLAQDLAVRGVRLPAAGGPPRPAVAETAPVSASYRGHTVWSAPEPYGGPSVLAALRFLEQAPPAALEEGAWGRTAWLLEAFAYARAGGPRTPLAHLQGVPPMPLPLADSLTRPAATGAGSAASGRGDGATRPDRAVDGDPAPSPRPPGGGEETTHFSIVDDMGNAVAVTQTLGSPFGSGASGSGLGFLYGDGTFPPPTPPSGDSAAGVEGTSAGEPAAGRAGRGDDGEGEWAEVGEGTGPSGSLSLAPAIVMSGERVRLVLGSPGGARGLAAIVQVIVRVIDLGEPLGRAVLSRRLHMSDARAGEPRRVYLEGVVWSDSLAVRQVDVLWGSELTTRMLERGMALGERDFGPVVRGLDPWFGGVNAVGTSGGRWTAVGDERRDGAGGVLLDGAFTLQGEPGGAIVTDPGPAPNPPTDSAAPAPPPSAGRARPGG